MNKKSNNNILGLIKRNHLLNTVEENIYKSIHSFQTDYIKNVSCMRFVGVIMNKWNIYLKILSVC